MWAVYWTGVVLWKIMVGCAYLFCYFFLFAALVGKTFIEAAVALSKLIATSWRALMQKAAEKSLEEASEGSTPIKAKPGPRDYNLPE